MHKYTQMCTNTNIHIYTQLYNLLIIIWLYRNMHDYAQTMPKYQQTCTNMHKYSQMCTNIHKCAKYIYKHA